MFGFLKRPAEVLDHWIAFTDGLVLPPSEFYAAVEAELAGRKIPGLQVTRLELPEGGLLSEKRTYLRLVRERLVFDVGAAPFGTGFFFSCRTAEIPLVLKPGQLLAVLLLVAFVLWWLVRTFGLFQGRSSCSSRWRSSPTSCATPWRWASRILTARSSSRRWLARCTRCSSAGRHTTGRTRGCATCTSCRRW